MDKHYQVFLDYLDQEQKRRCVTLYLTIIKRQKNIFISTL